MWGCYDDELPGDDQDRLIGSTACLACQARKKSGGAARAAAANREIAVGHRQSGDAGWRGRLVDEIGRAARAGWGQTFRLCVLLAVAAGAVALVLAVGR